MYFSTTGYVDVVHSVVDSTVPKRVYKVSGYSSICIWKVHMTYVHLCTLYDIQSCSVQLTDPALSLLLDYLQPCHMGFCHGSSHLASAILDFAIFGGSHLVSMGSHLAKCISLQATNLSTYLTKCS